MGAEKPAATGVSEGSVAHCHHCDCEAPPDTSPAPAAQIGAGVRFRIATMDCAVEESEIRRALEGNAGVRTLRFQLGARTLSIDADPPALEAALATLRGAGFDPQRLDEAPTSRADEDAALRAARSHELWRMVAALAFALGAEGLELVVGEAGAWPWVGMGMAVVAIALAGLDVLRKGWNALRRFNLNISALMVVAVVGAVLIGEWPEAAMVMVLYAIAEAIEARSVDRARNAITKLMAATPEVATVLNADGSTVVTPVAQVAIDTNVQVRPGERFPMDGVVTHGNSAVNQAPITGESMPVDKTEGDPVFAGTINGTGTLRVKVTAASTSSTLARIIHAVEQAQGSRAPTQRFVDRFARIYTPSVFGIALAVMVLAPLIAGWSLHAAVYRALVLLVIACPCALVISTPVTIVSGLAAAARRGILIKGGVHLEQARKLRVVAFDKTGTITEGRPQLVAWEVVDAAWERRDVETLAAAIAGQSDHPVSVAIARGLTAGSRSLRGFRALPGRGSEAVVDDATYVLGNHRLIEERTQCSPALEAALRTHEASGRTTAILASPTGLVALFAVADTLKESSRAAVASLKAMGVLPVMLSGDNAAAAASVAAAVGIDEATGNLLPEDKLEIIRALQAKHGPVAMIGDGINDAPALTQADIGIAMGAAGTDIAMEAADIVVMNDDLGRIAETVDLSHATYRVLAQNITLALGIKAVFLALALFGHASMLMAVFADMGASLLVLFNGLRLLRK